MSQTMQVVANYFGNKRKYEPVPGKSIHWAGGRQAPPPDTPKCGFDGSKCPPDGIVHMIFKNTHIKTHTHTHIFIVCTLAEVSGVVRVTGLRCLFVCLSSFTALAAKNIMLKVPGI